MKLALSTYSRVISEGDYNTKCVFLLIRNQTRVDLRNKGQDKYMLSFLKFRFQVRAEGNRKLQLYLRLDPRRRRSPAGGYCHIFKYY